MSGALYAQTDVTVPSDPVLPVDLDGTTGSSPPSGAEDAFHAIDNVRQKYLNFGEPAGATSEQNTGFIVTPSLGAPFGTIVTGLRLYTANDAEPRDPASFRLEGSITGTGGPWIPIAGTLLAPMPLALPSGRNITNMPPDFTGTTPINSASDFLQEVSFANAVPYTSYRLIFPTVKDSATAPANSMQIAEVEFLGVAVPEPSTFVLAGAGLFGLGCVVRRRRG